jgi:pimeloyl-ACP methyl ester carboxylesterase
MRAMSVAVAERAATSPEQVEEVEQVERANSSGKQPVIFIHGLWLLAGSWDRWAELFEAGGYAPVKASWPDDPKTVAEARAHPQAFAGKTVGQVVDHIARVIRQLKKKPAVVGHSFGGLMTQILAGRGMSAASVAIDPAPFRGVLPVPIAAVKSAWPVLRNPANRGRSVMLTYDQFRYGWSNALGDGESRALYDTFHVAGSGTPVFQAVMANLNPWTEVRVDSTNPGRGPLLIIEGGADHTVPPSIANASFRLQRRNPGVTEMKQIPNRGHSLVIDAGWQDVAKAALEFVKRFV